MSGLSHFKAHVLSNLMVVEAILHEVYAARCAGRTEFALFDGGAHKAYHTMRMLDLPGCAQVHAVEADPFMAETFLDIIGRQRPDGRDRLVFHRAALQDDPARKRIPWKSSSSHAGRSSIVARGSDRATIWEDNTEMQYRTEFDVPATTIDAILAEEPRPVPFLKLDLEGADLLALRGATATLRDRRPVVAFENSVHAPMVHGFTIEDMAARFGALGYVPINFAGEPMSPANWFEFFEAWPAPAEDVPWLSRQLASALDRRGL